jgi:hypothetical protein
MPAMATDAELREKLRKIEALHAGAGTPGERMAAAAALERIRARLRQQEQQRHHQQHQEQRARIPPVEIRVSLADPWSRQLFMALCRSYGLAPFRYPRQRRTTVMVRVPRVAFDRFLWPEFRELSAALTGRLNEVTARMIRDEVMPARRRA